MRESTRPVPIMIKKEEALHRRIHSTHKKRPKITLNLKKSWTGFRGEQNLDYHLSFLPKKIYSIIPDLRLPYENDFFQIDSLVLSPSFILLIESKNLFGTLFFDEYSKQLIRTFQGQEEGFPHPLVQVQRQKENLTLWLKSQKIKPCPIEYLVAIGSPSTILRTNPGKEYIFDRIMHAEHIPHNELRLKYKQTQLSPYLLQKLIILFQQHHTPPQIDILNKYQIHPSEIIQGVICPMCDKPNMIRVHANWYCSDCKHYSKDGHQEAIEDYLYLFDSITNKQCRDFLGLSSINVCTRLLMDLNLSTSGSGKNRTYFRPSRRSFFPSLDIKGGKSSRTSLL